MFVAIPVNPEHAANNRQFAASAVAWQKVQIDFRRAATFAAHGHVVRIERQREMTAFMNCHIQGNKPSLVRTSHYDAPVHGI
jgi:hypothetical protein